MTNSVGCATPGLVDPSTFLSKKATGIPAASNKGGTLDPDQFVTQSVAAAASGVQKVCAVGLTDPKASKVFFRVRPGEEWHRFGLNVLFPEGSDITKAMLVHPEFTLPAEFDEFVRPANLFLVHDHKGSTNFYLFPDSQNSWHVSRFEIALEAEGHWVKMRSDRANNCYISVTPPERSTLYVTEPRWPDVSFVELFNMAFQNRLITSENDPVLKQLSGMSYGK